MRIVLAQMPPNPRDTPPYDVALAAAILRRAGHEVVVRDANNEIYHQVYKQRPYWKFKLASHQEEPSFALFEERPELFEREAETLLASSPDAIVFRTENGFYNALMTARFLKDKRPDLALVSSGSVTPDKEILDGWRNDACFTWSGEYHMPFDYHVVGEDDLVLPRVLEAVGAGRTGELASQFKVSGKIIDSRDGSIPADLDQLPFYDFTDFDFSRYADPQMMRLNVSRGCPKRCAFCIDWIVVRKFRCMSGERWFEEYLCQMKRHPGVRHFRHYDRLLNGDLRSLERFTDLMLGQFDAPPVHWGGDCVVMPEMGEGLLTKMARAGCNNLGVGFESGSERVRRSMDKGFFSNADAEAFLRACKASGIGATVNVIVGFPTETEADFLETLGFIERNRGNIFEIRVTMPTLRVGRGSLMALAPKRYGIADVHEDRWTASEGGGYAERVDRFRRLCERMVELGVRLAVNRRIVKNAASVRHLLEELAAPEPPRAALPSGGLPPDAWARFQALRTADADLDERISLAETLLEEFPDEDSRRVEILMCLGYWRVQAGRAEAARPCFEAVTRREPPTSRFGYNARRGLSDLNLQRRGDIRAAIAERKAILAECGRAPDFRSELHYEIAGLHVRLNEREAAATHLRTILEKWPDPGSPWVTKARTGLGHLDRGDPPESWG
ncbi:MAG: radical SAM protein [Elusimicrobia bacterium]|nr:radical SAM protein [Elusimicrobiota bacterium]